MSELGKEYRKARLRSIFGKKMAVLERSITQINRAYQRDSVVMQLRAYGAARVYAGLLAYAVNKGWRVGWAAHAFKEIYGEWPNRYRDVDPAILPDCVVEIWVAMRPKKPRKKPKPALLEQVAAPPSLPVVNGHVEGTLMTPEDFEVNWT